eukprot:NODE_11558_length_1278_cov_8.461338.p1 GENE.NODE_11558_length_1278_cov_8.461338~~NODE_11558_length_1278_cov_8.461338.p1  ORF type:complete len:382 (-),score=41.76 NODE_11558_length_1278_cov_8.461338:131-1108(-)
MTRPELVRDCVHSMQRAVQVPVTVKCRLGVDHQDSPEFTAQFVRTVAQAGVKHFIVHARKAWLNGLSPAQNRTVPPLHHDRVIQLCNEFPDLNFTINGGITTLSEVRSVMRGTPRNLVGVMLGRAALANPCMLWDVDRSICGATSNPLDAPSRGDIVNAYCDYLDKTHGPDGLAATSKGTGSAHLAIKPILGAFAGCSGTRLFRQALDKNLRNLALRSEGPAAIVRSALAALADEQRTKMFLTLPLEPSTPEPSSGVMTSTAPSRLCGQAELKERGAGPEVADEPDAKRVCRGLGAPATVMLQTEAKPQATAVDGADDERTKAMD